MKTIQWKKSALKTLSVCAFLGGAFYASSPTPAFSQTTPPPAPPVGAAKDDLRPVEGAVKVDPSGRLLGPEAGRGTRGPRGERDERGPKDGPRGPKRRKGAPGERDLNGPEDGPDADGPRNGKGPRGAKGEPRELGPDGKPVPEDGPRDHGPEGGPRDRGPEGGPRDRGPEGGPRGAKGGPRDRGPEGGPRGAKGSPRELGPDGKPIPEGGPRDRGPEAGPRGPRDDKGPRAKRGPEDGPPDGGPRNGRPPAPPANGPDGRPPAPPADGPDGGPPAPPANGPARGPEETPGAAMQGAYRGASELDRYGQLQGDVLNLTGQARSYYTRATEARKAGNDQQTVALARISERLTQTALHLERAQHGTLPVAHVVGWQRPMPPVSVASTNKEQPRVFADLARRIKSTETGATNDNQLTWQQTAQKLATQARADWSAKRFEASRERAHAAISLLDAAEMQAQLSTT